MTPVQDLVQTLSEILEADELVHGGAIAERTAHVWDPAPLQAAALARPRTVAGVAAVVKACHEHGQHVITHGGLTGLVKGTESGPQDIVLSLERLNEIESIDPVGRTVTVQAGAVLEKVQDTLAEHDLQLGLDLGARGSCTIGGNIATNAGGLSVLRYGMMREQVLGLEVVLADGTVVSSLNALIKNNTGVDLKQLFIGSEGTLGVVTRAVLRTRSATPHARTVLAGCKRFEQVTDLLAHLDRNWGDALGAYEVLWNRFYQLNTDTAHTGYVDAPLDRDLPIYVIAEISGSDAQSVDARYESALEHAMNLGLMTDAVLPQSENERQRVWRLRENVETQLRHTPAFVYDVSLPITSMPDYLASVEAALQAHWPEVALYAYGHLADGNLHLIVAPLPIGSAPDEDTDIDAWHRTSDEIVYTPLQAIGGSISAEHGIGLSKKDWLHVSRNDAERELMHRLKHALDPAGILNPGRIL